MDIQKIIGKTFIDKNDDWYGSIRELSEPLPTDVDVGNAVPFAEDECGNLFVLKNSKAFFWDHETNELLELASSLNDFIAGCVDTPEVKLDSRQVISAWINPEFAKGLGVKSSKDGWIKKS